MKQKIGSERTKTLSLRANHINNNKLLLFREGITLIPYTRRLSSRVARVWGESPPAPAPPPSPFSGSCRWPGSEYCQLLRPRLGSVPRPRRSPSTPPMPWRLWRLLGSTNDASTSGRCSKGAGSVVSAVGSMCCGAASSDSSEFFDFFWYIG